LHAIARANVARLRDRLQCPQIELIHADASTYQVPAEVTVVYIFNSFSGWVLERVLEQLRQSVAASPRKLAIVFCAPPECDGDPLGGCRWLQVTRTLRGVRDRTIWFYQAQPAPLPGNREDSPVEESTGCLTAG
jgi:hypothetical protein